MSDLMKKTRKSSLITFPAQIVNRAIGILYAVVLARGLSVEQFGIYSFVVGALLVFGFLCNFGLAASLVRFIAEYAKLERFGILLKTVVFAHLFRFFMSILALGSAYLWFPYWADTFGLIEYKQEFFLFSIGAFFLFQLEYFQVEFNAVFLHWASSIMQLLYGCLKFIIAIIMLSNGAELAGLLAAEAAAYLTAFIFACYVFMKHMFFPYKSELKNTEPIEYARLGRYSGLSALIIPGNIMYSRSMDFFVIAAMANPYQLGLYALGSRVSRMLNSIMPQVIMQGVFRPVFFHRYYDVEDKAKELERMWNTLVRLIALCLFPSVILLMILAQPVINVVFGAEYIEAAATLQLLVGLSIFTCLEFPSDMVLQAIEKVEARLYAQIFAIYNVVAAIMLFPRFGILGVAFATGTASIFKCLFFAYMARHYTGLSIKLKPLLQVAFNAMLAGLVSYGIISKGADIFYLLLSISGGLITYAMLTWFNNYMSQEEKKMANQLLKRKIFDV